MMRRRIVSAEEKMAEIDKKQEEQITLLNRNVDEIFQQLAVAKQDIKTITKNLDAVSKRVEKVITKLEKVDLRKVKRKGKEESNPDEDTSHSF